MNRDWNSERYLSDAAAILAGLTQGEVGVWRWTVGTDRLEWTDNLETIHDLPPQSFSGNLSDFSNDIHPEDRAKVWSVIEKTVKTDEPYKVMYRTNRSDPSEERWIEAAGGMIVQADGTRILTGVCYDVTSRTRSEAHLKRRSVFQEGIARLGTFALSEPSVQKVFDFAVNLASEIFDAPLAKILQFTDDADSLFLRAGVGWKDGLVGRATVGIDRDSQAGYTLLKKKPVIVRNLGTEKRFSGPKLLLEHGVVSGLSMVIPGTGIRPFGVIGVHTVDPKDFDDLDVEALQSFVNILAQSLRAWEADNGRNLLMREMAHRSGNLLQLVSVIANQTFTDAKPIAAALGAFRDRLSSLARANRTIAQGGWGPTRIIDIVENSLGPFEGRYSYQGRDLKIPGDLAFDLGMIIHELVTNSAKYGALKTDGEHIELRWKILRDGPDRKLFFQWSDPHSSYTSNEPGSGFGFKLKQSLVERKWNGRMKVERGRNYQFSFEIPL